MWNFLKVQKTGNYKYLGINSKIDDFESEGAEMFAKLYDTFISELGLAKEYLTYLETKRKAVLSLAEYIINEDKAAKMKFKFAMADIEVADKEIKEFDYYEIKPKLEQYLGRRINEKEESVKDIYTLIKDYGNYIQREHTRSKRPN
jgi:hypothetical protein